VPLDLFDQRSAGAGGAAAVETRPERIQEDVGKAVVLQFVPPMANTCVMVPDEFLPGDVEEEFGDLTHVTPLDEHDEIMADLFADDATERTPAETRKTPLFPALWRSHESGQWKPRDEQFRGFRSPPGRFHHSEREDDAPLT